MSVALPDLPQHIALMHLLDRCIAQGFLIVLPVLALDLILDLLVLVVSQPVALIFSGLLHLDGKSTAVVDLLHQVYARVVFFSPLVVPDLLLLLGLNCSQVLDKVFFLLCVCCRLKVVLLKLHYLFASDRLLLVLQSLQFRLLMELSRQHVSVPVLLMRFLLLSEASFDFVVCDKIKVALSVENK